MPNSHKKSWSVFNLGPRYQNHLIHEHGVVFDVEYLIKISIHKRDHKNQLPDFVDPSEKIVKKEVEKTRQIKEEKSDIESKLEMVTIEIQTDPTNEENSVTSGLCVKCNKSPVLTANLNEEANGSAGIGYESGYF